MRDCLVLVDVFNDFEHEDGDELLRSFRARLPELRRLLELARERAVPIVYANDTEGVFDHDVRTVVTRAQNGRAGAEVDGLTPADGDRFLVKPRYSAFDHTPLALILRDLEIERLVAAGMSTEGCVAQTAIAAREEGLKVAVVPSACATVDPELERIALAYLERVVGARLEPPDTVGRGAKSPS